MSANSNLSSLPDSDLLQSCLNQKDRDAFAILVDRYKNLICSVAYNILGDLGQSEDIAQETFVSAWKKLDSLREPENLKSWLCGIARNLSLSVVRKRKPEQEPSEEAINHEAPDAIAVANEEEAMIWDALEKLPSNYREPLILFYREDQSVNRVAEDLELSEEAVKQRLSRGRAMLRDRMLSIVEGTLAATRPGPAFTVAVISALPAVLASTAAAATLGTAGKVGGAGTVAAISSGAVAGSLGGLLGGLFGWYAGDQTARYQEQRNVLKKGMILIFIFVGIFQIPWISMYLGWWEPKDLGPGGYMIFWFSWMISFFAVLGILSWRLGKQSREIHKKNIEAGVAPLPPTPARRFLQRWEGRRWTTKAKFLGLPLVSIAFADPDRDFSGYNHLKKEGQLLAKGWIALGDRAIGLIACGNFAFGGIAFGSISVGVLSFGGLAAGGISFGGLTLAAVSLGGLAIGVAAIGGMAVGIWAYGGAAVAWIAAKGGFAYAGEFALGGGAFAEQANTEIALKYFTDHSFFQFGDSYLALFQSPWFLPIFWVTILAAVAVSICVAFRRKQVSPAETEEG